MSGFPSLEDGDFELYGLDALDPGERALVLRAIAEAEPAEREEILRRIAGAEEAAAAVVDAADLDETPPERVRTAVLDAVATRDRAGADERDPVLVARPRFRPVAVLAAAALALVLGGSVAAVALRSGDRADDVAGPEESTSRSVGDAPVSPSDPVGMAERISAMPDARVADEPLGSGASARVSMSEGLDMAVVEISGMPAPREGMYYQLWLDGRGPSPVAGGPMSMADDGRTLMGGIDGLARTSGVALTEEPDGDPYPAAPTGKVLMSMEMR